MYKKPGEQNKANSLKTYSTGKNNCKKYIFKNGCENFLETVSTFKICYDVCKLIWDDIVYLKEVL